MTQFTECTETGIRGRLYLEGIQVRRGGVTISVENEQGESWQIVFDYYLAIRVADDGYRLMTAPQLPTSGCRVLEARESEFIGWIRQESAEMNANEVLIHTVVLTTDDIVEVVSFEPALIRHSTEPVVG